MFGDRTFFAVAFPVLLASPLMPVRAVHRRALTLLAGSPEGLTVSLLRPQRPYRSAGRSDQRGARDGPGVEKARPATDRGDHAADQRQGAQSQSSPRV
jgi:hypothetical protein